MLKLVVDRSAAVQSVALMQGSEIIAVKEWSDNYASAPIWLLESTQMVTNAGFSLEQIHCYICGLGPGSFSGIRSALATVQGLALPGNKLIKGVSSAASIALSIMTSTIPAVTVIGDARRNQLWHVTYCSAPDSQGLLLGSNRVPYHDKRDFTLTPAEQIVTILPPDTLIVSPDWLRLQPLLLSAFAPDRLLQKPVMPSVSCLGWLAHYSPANTNKTPQPIYLHPPVVSQPCK